MSVSRDKKRGTWTVEAWYRNSMGERHKKTKREILKEVEDYRAGRLETYGLDEVKQHLGLDD